MKRALIALPALIMFLFPSIARAQQHYTTYAGAVMSLGANSITYKDWIDNEQASRNVSGSHYGGGVLLDLFVNMFIGEFSMQYLVNSNDGDTSVNHLLFVFTGKYAYEIQSWISATAGIGLYMETPPASQTYDGGGGFNVTIGTLFRPSRDWNIVVDSYYRYGQFGMGQDSTKTSYGLSLGVIRKVGQI